MHHKETKALIQARPDLSGRLLIIAYRTIINRDADPELYWTSLKDMLSRTYLLNGKSNTSADYFPS